MFELAVGKTPCELKHEDYVKLGTISEGFTGSDISIVVQDALMQPVRKIQSATHWKKVTDSEGRPKVTPCSPGDKGAFEQTWENINSEDLLEPPLQYKDFERAIRNTRPTVSQEDIDKSKNWTEEFGSEGA